MLRTQLLSRKNDMAAAAAVGCPDLGFLARFADGDSRRPLATARDVSRRVKVAMAAKVEKVAGEERRVASSGQQLPEYCMRGDPFFPGGTLQGIRMGSNCHA
jgi:hypothetical protein